MICCAEHQPVLCGGTGLEGYGGRIQLGGSARARVGKGTAAKGGLCEREKERSRNPFLFFVFFCSLFD